MAEIGYVDVAEHPKTDVVMVPMSSHEKDGTHIVLGTDSITTKTIAKIPREHIRKDFSEGTQNSELLIFCNYSVLPFSIRKIKKKSRFIGVCRALPNFKKEMRKNEVFEHFLPCRLPKGPVNRRFLRLFAAKIHKSDRLLGNLTIIFDYITHFLCKNLKFSSVFLFQEFKNRGLNSCGFLKKVSKRLTIFSRTVILLNLIKVS